MNIGPLEIETKLSATGALAVALAFTALVGGWYRFDYRIAALENDHQEDVAYHEKELEFHQKLNDTLGTLNVTVGKLEQEVSDQQAIDKAKHEK